MKRKGFSVQSLKKLYKRLNLHEKTRGLIIYEMAENYNKLHELNKRLNRKETNSNQWELLFSQIKQLEIENEVLRETKKLLEEYIEKTVQYIKRKFQIPGYQMIKDLDLARLINSPQKQVLSSLAKDGMKNLFGDE